jgi:GT2 family glycosyltransferase
MWTDSKKFDRKPPFIAIIILNWNGWKDTVECLESLYRITYTDYAVIVVDNGSTDDSVEKISTWCRGNIPLNFNFSDPIQEKKPLTLISFSREEIEDGYANDVGDLTPSTDTDLILIRNSENEGFGKGNNVGISFAMNILDPDYILLLNNDTVVDPKFLSEMVEVAERHHDAGIVGSKIFYYDCLGKKDVVWERGGGTLNPLSSRVFLFGPPPAQSENDNISAERQYITGCAFLISRKVLEKLSVPGFDPAFFCYYEDTDLSLRCTDLGFKCYYAPKSILWHKCSASAGGSKSPFSIFHETRSRVIFVRKHSSSLMFLIFLLRSMFIDQFFFFFSAVFSIKRPGILIDYYRGFLDGLSYHR